MQRVTAMPLVLSQNYLHGRIQCRPSLASHWPVYQKQVEIVCLNISELFAADIGDLLWIVVGIVKLACYPDVPTWDAGLGQRLSNCRLYVIHSRCVYVSAKLNIVSTFEISIRVHSCEHKTQFEATANLYPTFSTACLTAASVSSKSPTQVPSPSNGI